MSEVSIFYPFLSYLSSAVTFLPFVIGIYKKNILSKELKVLWLLITCSIVTELIGYVIVYGYKANNVQLFNVYVIIETILISGFYYLVIQNKIQSLFCISLAIIFSIYAIIQLVLNPSKTLDTIFLTTESVIVISFSIMTFHNLIKDAKFNNILSLPIFWINSAFLLFFSGNLFLHLFSQFLQEYAQKAFYELWGFHSILNIILYVLISIGFWKTRISQT